MEEPNYEVGNMNELQRLLELGRIEPGTALTWKRRNGVALSAIINADGTLATDDGKTHRTPSGAARHYVGRPVDGWKVWTLPSGQRLDDVRKLAGGMTDD